MGLNGLKSGNIHFIKNDFLEIHNDVDNFFEKTYDILN